MSYSLLMLLVAGVLTAGGQRLQTSMAVRVLS